MHAQLSIAHGATAAVAIRAGLEEVFGSDDRAVLARSEVFSSNSSTWKDLVIYSTERPTYRLVCSPARNDELQVIVEPVDEDVRRACQSAWSGLRRVLKDKKPRLQSAEIYDFGSSRVVMTAQTGFVVEVRRREILSLLVIGIVTAIWIAVGTVTFARGKGWELIGGGLPGLVGGVMGLLFAASNWRRDILRWQE